MTAIEHKELKGITVKNLVVTVFSTASIVASVITTYCNLKTDIKEVKLSQETETRINDIRIKVLESQVILFQKQMAQITHSDTEVSLPSARTSISPNRLSAYAHR